MAINRGESNHLLSVKVKLYDSHRNHFLRTLHDDWIRRKRYSPLAEQIIQESLEDSFKRLIEPSILRHARLVVNLTPHTLHLSSWMFVRSELNRRAEKESIEVFARNLRNLLLAPPVKGKTVLGIDPGFKHGCKFAVTSPTGFGFSC